MARTPHQPHERHAAVLREVGARLAAGGVPSPEADARWLVDHVTEVAGDPVGCGAALLDGLVARRLRREPLQHVIGRTWFRLLELRCTPGVFIPRPETEIVAGLAIAAARAASEARAPLVPSVSGGNASAGGAGATGAPPAPSVSGGNAQGAGLAVDGPRVAEPVRVVEVCTGTGAIALSIAVEVPHVEVIAGDIDPAAVELATVNLGRVRDGSAGAPLADGTTLTVVASDLLDGVEASWRGHLDVLVANPPYLPASDRGTWEPEVADHDPDRALVGGPDGHEVVDELLRLAAGWLRPGGTVIVEIDERRGADALAVAHDAGLVGARIECDLTGAGRAVVAHRPTSAS